uniref:Uncharacterized protein n=1 Tax=Tanacetum cinerariifolium TaxID=118510 RepID=A0A6L2LEI8_TANCI|nr:hypothetical protein [Tanacetum cinerariifolium]
MTPLFEYIPHVGFSLAFVIHISVSKHNFICINGQLFSCFCDPYIAVLGRLSGTTVYQNYTKCFMVTMLHESVVVHETVSESYSSVDVPLLV